MNKYSKAFNSNMTPKQVTLLYYRLYDEAAKDKNDLALLKEAHMKAWEAATKRENAEWDKKFEEGYILCTN